MHRNIIILGLVSLVTDVSSEMVYPLMPLYLTAVLGASPAILGLIEGIAESLASLLKVGSGRLADHFAARKPLAITGYGLSAIGKVLFVVATTWTGILAARVADRFGKGIRTAPRDAIIAEAAGTGAQGKSFGFHRAMDTAGAVLGIILAYWLFTTYQGNFGEVFWLAAIPALAGVGLLLLVSEPVKRQGTAKRPFSLKWGNLDRRLRLFLLISFLFNLGNSSNQFLLVWAGQSGFAPEQVILLYLLMNLTYLALSYPAGLLSDRIGRRGILVCGYAFYGLVYLGFAAASASWHFIGLFAAYGLYTGLTEGVEKALLADIAPQNQRATIYGLHAMIVGMALLPASILAGLLWQGFGPSAPFLFGGMTGLSAAGALWLGLQRSSKPPETE